MEKIFSEIEDILNRAENVTDPRTRDWPLVKYISSPLLALCCYASIVVFGPRIMQTRKAFELKGVMAVYNFVSIILCGFILLKLVVHSIKANYSYMCQIVYTSLNNPEELEIAKTIWWFYISKYFEMLDTIFFILRKKNKQVSFLHVYHHSSVLMLWWMGTKWVPGGTTIVPAIMNSFVHVVMYTYYGLSIFPSLRKYLWWKKHLTQAQMAQFCLLFFHSIMVYFGNCTYSNIMVPVCMIYMVTLLILFGKFYLQAYISRKKNKEATINSDYSNEIHKNNNAKKIS